MFGISPKPGVPKFQSFGEHLFRSLKTWRSRVLKCVVEETSEARSSEVPNNVCSENRHSRVLKFVEEETSKA
jgi:hypothetical protein